MTDILYAPDRERVVTTNVWAFLHWLHATRGVELTGWEPLQRWSVDAPGDFRAAIAAFARLPETPSGLVRRRGPNEALVLRGTDGSRTSFSWDQVQSPPGRLPPTLPQPIAASLGRLWPAAALVRPVAELLLHSDLRRDDRLLVIGPAWPWLAALLEGTSVILAAPVDPLATAAAERASVLVAPAQALAEAAFQRSHRRPDLSSLHTIVATGGPLSPEGRRRIYTWAKSDLLLLARTGDTLWGNPLEPVTVRARATPAFFRPPASIPATR